MTLKRQHYEWLVLLILITLSTTNTIATNQTIEINYVTTENCNICQYQNQYHQELKTNYTNQIQINKHPIENIKQQKKEENWKINQTIETAPATIINNKLYQGFNSNIKNKIQNEITTQLGEPPEKQQRNTKEKPKDNSTVQKINQLLQQILN